ncbi:flagellar basal body-associated FliL family protein [Hyphobacterium sp. HN65]|uniref:Flagellar protein FliL n=1 Tax=Hyphobacterium lacteum TaxID=3116575 RepID=A0ABU7LRC2_9PROT|nr:flagellar basal body-associated FliL family protein [Hyphobacterium sp. HN65]MEE2526186.1 flagellar basal body-associated FliL family protein [Hyphobacterium sp. HN65]
MADEEDEIENEGADAEDESEDGEGEGKKKPGIMKLALFIGLPVVILALGGVAAMLLFSGGGNDEDQVAEAGEHGEVASNGHGGGAGHGEDLYPHDLEQLQISISDGRGGFSILQMDITFETPDEHFGDNLTEAETRRIADQFLGFLRELRPEDLAGSAGLERVRMELLRRAQLILGEDRVRSVLITNLLIV